MSSSRRKLGVGKFPIVTRKHGSLKFHIENLAIVQTKATNFHKHRLAPVAIFCPTVTRPEVFSNILLHYFRCQQQKGWLVDDSIYSEIGKDNYFKFSDNDPSGIYGYPSLYTLNQKDYTILLHIHYNQLDPRRDKDPLENLLLLFCSRIVEINLSDLKFSTFESVNNLSTSNLPKYLCRDIGFITRVHDGDTVPQHEEKYNLDGFQKINFIFANMDWATFSNNFNQKSMPPEMKTFIENIVQGMVTDFGLGSTTPLLGELLLYFKKCFDSLTQKIPKNPTKRNVSLVQSTSERNVLEEIADAQFTSMRDKIVEGFQDGSSDLYNNIVSGNFEVDQNTILRRCQTIIVALKLTTSSIQNFRMISEEKFQQESAQLSSLAEVLKLIHDRIVDNIVEVGNLAGYIIEEVVNQTCNEEPYSPFIEKIARMLPHFFKFEKNRKLIHDWAIFPIIVSQTKLRYDAIFQVALSKQSFSCETFNMIHVDLSTKCIAAMETALVFLSHKMGSVAFQISNKEEFFREEYLTNREYNLDNLESCCKAIKYFVKGIKGQYDLKMQEDLKSNTAITYEDFEGIHHSALSAAEKNFEENIKTSEYSIENFDEHVKVLRYRINQAFEGYKVRCNSRFVPTPSPSVASVKSLNQPVALLMESDDYDEVALTLPELKPALLACQITLNKLVCKIIFEENDNAPEFEFHVELAVALLEDGQLLVGDSYAEFSQKNVIFPKNTKVFKIRDCFLSNLGDWSEIVEIGNSKRKINEVFLLGLIFADLKTKLMVKHMVSIEKVVATMPNWLATVNRTKIRAAFSIAGFENVQLTTESFAVSKNEGIKLSDSHNANKISVFGELEDGELKKADLDNNEIVSRMSKQRRIIKYYEERTNGIYHLGTLMLHKPKSSRELITYFKVENGDVKLDRVESRKPSSNCEFCNKSCSVKSQVLDDDRYSFFPAAGEICKGMGNFIRELIQENFQNLDGNPKEELKVKCAFLKSAYDKGEIKFKSTLGQKLFLKEIDEVGKLVRSRNPSLDDIKKKMIVLEKFEAKYLNEN